MTNQKGEYTISVPIGQHAITVAKSGHIFVNNGRYPADPHNTGEKFTFDREIKGLEFRDTAGQLHRPCGGWQHRGREARGLRP